MFLKSKAGRRLAVVAAVAFAATFAALPAHADIVGELRCNVAGGAGALIVSSRPVSCVFHSNAGPAERYSGSINRLGVDIGELSGGQFFYSVAALGAPAPGALAGDYIGAGFGVTVGTGGGLNALVGGGAGSFTLQPISATTSTGANVNAGLGALRLVYAGPDRLVMRRHRLRHRRHLHRM